MSAILDRGSLLWASIGVVLVELVMQQGGSNWGRMPFYGPLLVLAAFYVPGLLLIGAAAGRWGGFQVSFQRDYQALLTCTAMAWSAANLPVALVGLVAPAPVLLAMAGVAAIYSLVLVFFAVRTVFGAANSAAVVMVCLSWIPLVAAAFLWDMLFMMMRWLASPFFLFYAWYFLGGEFSGLGAGMRQRQNFRRTLDAATLNPHDGEAQYQLGLIYQGRRNYTEAIARFQQAVKIDPEETDAHYQLGRIAREQGRMDDALAEFKIVAAQDPKHNLSEVLRDLGGTCLDQGRFQDALAQLAVYVDRRPYDPEGLYYYGRTLEGLRRTAEAFDAYRQAVEAARTAPRYRRAAVARWSRLAQGRLRTSREM